jgi:Fe2+ transport system protein B
MTGGLGFVKDMMNRDKTNRTLLQDIRERRKQSKEAHRIKPSLNNIKWEENKLENTESTLREIKNIQKLARKEKLKDLILWTIIGLGLFTLFLFLLIRYIF